MVLYNSTRYCFTECHLCYLSFMLSVTFFIVMLRVIMLSVVMQNGIMLSVVMLNGIMLGVVAPIIIKKSAAKQERLNDCKNVFLFDKTA
jgi:hypothetical protein